MRLATSLAELSGEARLALMHDMGPNSARDLGIYLNVPHHDRAGWEKGQEPQAVLDWLDTRGQFKRLSEALSEIGRDDLLKHLQVSSPTNSLPADVDRQKRNRYLTSRIRRWSQARFQLDTRFVDLSLVPADGAQPSSHHQRTFHCLAEVLEHVADPIVVVRAPPGGGKTTLLGHHELTYAQFALDAPREDADARRFAWYAPLDQFKGDETPADWLQTRWEKANTGLPSFLKLLENGRMELLLDGLNEMPTEVAPWRDFLREVVAQNPENRMVFACRTRDYFGGLESEEATASVVVVESLSDAQMEAFLGRYAPEQAAALWAQLKTSHLLDFYRTPYFLRLLVDEAGDGQIPNSLAALFTRVVREAWRRELRRDVEAVRTPGLVEAADLQRLQAGNWRSATDLPHQGTLIPRLARFAYDLQAMGEDNPGQARQTVHRTLDAAKTMALLGKEWCQPVLAAACSLRVLEQEIEGDDVRFCHQLLQEHFAARHFLRQPNFALIEMEWRASHATPTLAASLESLGGSDPLPYQPTAWDETLRAAASLAEDADDFIEAIAEHNLPLAGRAAAQDDVSVSTALTNSLRQRLVTRCEAPAADLRARIEAGLALGHLGDPRLTKHQGPHGDYLLAPFVAIPSDSYVIGSNTRTDEQPIRKVELTKFEVARYPVTNAEWALFMAAGGYDEEQWWVTTADKAWRSGKTTSDGPRNAWRSSRRFLQTPENFERVMARGDVTMEEAELYAWLAGCSDAEFDEWARNKYPDGRQKQPTHWRDDAFNNPSQPVVGICWHEARAYCAWLTAQTGSVVPYTLPTEVQWEAAARGGNDRQYPWPDKFTSERCNTFESQIRRTTPVGVYPGGDRVTSEDKCLSDMSGNVWEWTTSVYEDFAEGEQTNPGAEGSRVLRGGSWGYSHGDASASCRVSCDPGGRDDVTGFRLFRSSDI